jgi:hypothetical protein
MNFAGDGTPITSSPITCMRKKRYRSEDEAWAAIFRMRARQQDTERLVPYQCAYGDSHWHLGRTPPRMATDEQLRAVRTEVSS